MKKKVLWSMVLLTAAFLLLMLVDASAQCAMCKAIAESGNDATSGKMASGLNKGILYLMSLPYIFVIIAAFVWHKKKKEIKSFFNSAH